MGDDQVIVDKTALETLISRATKAEDVLNREFDSDAHDIQRAVDDVVTGSEPFDGSVYAIIGHEFDSYNTNPTGEGFLSKHDAEKYAMVLEQCDGWKTARAREIEVE